MAAPRSRTSRRREAFASLREETLRLGRLVDDLDTLARADAVGFTLARAPVALAEVVGEAADGLTGTAAEKELRLEVDVDPGVVVEADQARLGQVVGNLIVNALAFTPPGGTVGVRAGRDGDAAVVEVTDSGPGIPPDELDRVFDRFFRGRDARPGGSGIGLTVVHQIVAAHGGTVTAGNRPEGGARFTVRLPLARVRARP